MGNQKITTHQLFTMTALASLGGSLFVVASTVTAVARQDAWLSALAAVAYGVLIVLMYYYLGSRYPNMTLIGAARRILGKWAGTAAGIAFVYLFLSIAMHLPWYVSGFVMRTKYETPDIVFKLFFVAGVVIALQYGIETIARASEIFIVAATVVFVFSFVLLLRDVKLDYLLPVLESGVAPVLKGSVFLSCYITLSITTMLMLFPCVGKPSRALGAMLRGFLWSGGVSFAAILLCVIVLGSNLTSRLSFPVLKLVGEIDVFMVLTRLEYVISGIWYVTQLFIGIAFFYGGIAGLSELLGLKDHKPLILPFGLVATVMSGVLFPSTMYQQNWVNLVYAPWIITVGFFIPVLLVFVYIVKKHVFKRT